MSSNSNNRLPGCPRHYEVGYGKPPKRHRFKKGQYGNPRGRPKGAKRSTPALPEERLEDIVLEEAYRMITVHEGERTVTLSMAQAVIRKLAFDAAKGAPRAQRLFTQMLNKIEREDKERYDEWLKTEHAGQGTVIQVVFGDDEGERDDESGEGED